MGEFVRVERDEAIATIRLDRPPMNALNFQVQTGIAAAAAQVSADTSVKAVILYGGERLFCAGADIVQLFDSWVGILGPDDYRRFVLPHSTAVIAALSPRVPVIHFGTMTGNLLELMREGGGDVIGLDWRVDLGEAWARLGYGVGVQGNLDPVLLFADWAELKSRAEDILRLAAGRAGHIFNLGHGILPETPVDHVIALVDLVHEMSAR